MMLQSLIETPEEVDRASAHQARLQKLMLEAGGIAGPGSIGGPDMRQFFPVEELARDERFHTITNRERMGDPANGLPVRPTSRATTIA